MTLDMMENFGIAIGVSSFTELLVTLDPETMKILDPETAINPIAIGLSLDNRKINEVEQIKSKTYYNALLANLRQVQSLHTLRAC